MSAAEIENLVQARNPRAARPAIQAFLHKHSKRQPDVIFQACDWLRRLGLAEEALGILDLREPIFQRTTTQTWDGKRLLWAARLLNVLGASEFAIQLLSSLDLRTYDDLRIAGAIYLAHYMPVQAHEHLARAVELDPEPASYLSRLVRINFADTCMALGDSSRALELVRQVERQTVEPLLLGICAEVQGEYFSKLEQWQQALGALRRAEAQFPPSDTTADRALVDKWMGYALARSGELERGLVLLDRAYQRLRDNRLRPEAWLDVLRLREVAVPTGRLSAMGRYPGLAPRFQGFLGETPEMPRPHTDARWRVDLERDELWEDGRVFLGLPLEARLLAAVTLAGEWGLSLVRARSLLWPDEAYAYSQMEGRLHQLLRRLRVAHGFDIRLEQGMLLLPQSRDIEVVGLYSKIGNLEPSFWEGRGTWRRDEFERYYGLSQPGARKWIQRWKSEGKISEQGRGRQTAYRVV